LGYYTEHVGCKITNIVKSVMFTQPVLVQSLVDVFDAVNNEYMIPATARKSLQYKEKAEEIKKIEMKNIMQELVSYFICRDGQDLISAIWFAN
jgi:2-phosphoglycerate kinase